MCPQSFHTLIVLSSIIAHDVVRFEQRQAVKGGEWKQLRLAMEYRIVKVMYLVMLCMCTASECGSNGNNCEQSEDATTNIEI